MAQPESVFVPAASIVDAVREPLLVLCADLRVQSANRSFYETFRVEAGETEGRLIYELGNGQWDIPALRKLLNELLTERTTFDDFEVMHDFLDIGRKVMLLNARRLVQESDRRELILLAIEDITEKKRLEDERKELETRFTSLVKNIRDHSIFTLDIEGNITSWNREAERILGYTESETIGRHFSLIFSPEDIDAGIPAEELRLALTHGRAEDERWHLRKGGEPLWAFGIVTPTYDADGNHTGFSKILRDMTERRRADEALQASEQQFRELADAMPQLVWIANDKGVVEYYNKQASRFSGIEKSRVGCWNWHPVVHPDELEQTRAVWHAAVASGHPYEIEHRVCMADGGYRWHLSRAQRGANGKWFGTATDIHDLKQAQRVQQTMASRDRFRLTLSEALRPLADPVMIQGVASAVLGEHLGASRVLYAEMSRDGEYCQIDAHYRKGLPSVAGRHRLDDYGRQVMTDIREGRVVVIPDVQRDSRLTPVEQQRTTALGIFAYVMLPLTKDDRTVALLTVHYGRPHQWTTDELHAIEQTAERTWEAVERARAELALRSSEATLNAVLDSLPAGVLITDQQGRLLRDNIAFRELWGIPPDITSWEHYDNFVAWWSDTGKPIEADEWAMAKALKTGEITRDQLILNQKFGSGERRYYSNNVAPIRNEQGEIIGAVAALLDVTERRLAEQLLRESEERYRAVLESQSELIARFRIDGTLLFVNGPYARSQGVTPEDLVGGNFWELIPCEQHAEVRAMLDRLSPESPAIRIENMYITDQGPRWTLWTNHALAFDETGKAIEAQATGIDITDRKNMEEALRRSEERYRTLFDSIDEGFCIIQMLFDEQDRPVDYRFLEYNPAFERQTGLKDAVNRTMRELAPDHESHWFEMYGNVATTGEPSRFQNQAKALGRIFDVYAFRVGDPEERKVAVLFDDITKQQRSEEELLRLNDELRDADRRKNEFLATLAHELRNPLAPIRTGLELMKMVAGDREMLEQTRQTMERQTQQLITLVNDLLDVSRITRGKFELRKCRVALANVVENAVEAGRPFIDEANHELAVQIAEPPVYIEADPHRIVQVISNLLNNAAKYTPEGGRVTVTAGRENGEAVIAVTDTGVGIPADMQERVFEMFEQIDRGVDRTSSTGLGIGLTLVKSLVELHGGTIALHSEEPGRGSTVTVRLPLAETTEIDTPPVDDEPEELSATAKRRVLVVDDNKAAADMLSSVVKMLGNDVATAGDGIEAIEAAARFRPDIVLLDIGMPRMNGYDAARTIRQQSWGKHIMLVALTGWGQEEDKRKTTEAGFDHHLVKPAEPAALQALFSRVGVGLRE